MGEMKKNCETCKHAKTPAKICRHEEVQDKTAMEVFNTKGECRYWEAKR